MKMNLRQKFSALGTAAISLALVSSASAQVFNRPRLDIENFGSVTTDYSLYILGETQPSVTPSQISAGFVTRTSSSFGISPRSLPSGDGGFLTYAGAVSDGFSDGAATANRFNDLISFEINSLTAQPDFLSVTRRIVASTLDETNIVRTLAFGSIDDYGTIAFRYDNASTSFETATGLINATQGSTTVFTNDFDTPSSIDTFFQLAKTGVGETIGLPSIGETDGLSFSTTFLRQIVAQRSDLDPSPAFNPYGQLVHSIDTSGTIDNRSHATYNENPKLLALLRYNGASGAGYATGVAVFGVDQSSNSGFIQLSNLAGSPSYNGGTGTPLNNGTFLQFPNSPDGFPLIATNYFSRTFFVGPPVVSMNDNGDLAVLTTEFKGSTGGTTNVLNSIHKFYLVNKFDGASYTGWKIAASSTGIGFASVASAFKAVNPLGTGSAPRPLAATSPFLDNEGNVYFAATDNINSQTNSIANAIYKAIPNINGSWSVKRVLREGDNLLQNGNVAGFVSLIPVGVSSSLSSDNIRLVNPAALGPVSGTRDSGRLMAAITIGTTGNPTRWTYVLLNPK